MSTELTTPTAPEGNIKQLIESDRFKLAIASALPRHLRPERFIRVALTALTRTPKLAQCEQASFFQCLLTLSQFGLEPDGRNAHLIPFENRKRGVVECQLIVDFKGLCDLAMRSGKVAYIHADKVCENDFFEYDKGVIKAHRINFKQPRGDTYAYYAICHFKDGTEKCEAMTKDDIEKIRQRSRAKDAGPWVTDFDEMAKKTVFRRLSKWLQLSPEYRDALEADSDSLEEHRFEAALPAIARPVISEPAALEDRPKEEGKPKTKRGRPPKKGLEILQPLGQSTEEERGPEEKGPMDPGPTGTPHADALAKRMAEAGYLMMDLLMLAAKNKWLVEPEGWSGEAADLEGMIIPEDKAEMFLEDFNWALIIEEIEKSKSA